MLDRLHPGAYVYNCPGIGSERHLPVVVYMVYIKHLGPLGVLQYYTFIIHNSPE